MKPLLLPCLLARPIQPLPTRAALLLLLLLLLLPAPALLLLDDGHLP